MTDETKMKYALVARGTTPLAEYSLVQGNHRTIALKMLENVDPQSPCALVEQSQNVFFSITDPDRMTYLCLCGQSVLPAQRRSFLEELRNKWRQKYGNNASSFAADSKNKEFGAIEIRNLLNSFNSEIYSKLAQAKQNLAETQEQMAQNLTMAFLRHEQLNIMEEKAENIKDSAQTFQRNATDIRRKMCFQKYRWYFVGSLVAIIVIFLIIVVACGGFTFRKCK